MADRICRPCTYTLDVLVAYLKGALLAAALLREELKENAHRYEHRRGYRPSAKTRRRQARVETLARKAGVRKPTR
jgi:hypothetical protein